MADSIVAINTLSTEHAPFLCAVSDALIVADVSSGRIVFWNPKAAHVFGYSASEAYGLSIEDLVAGRFRNRVRAALAAHSTRDRRALPSFGKTRELVALHRSGTKILIEVSISQLSQPDREYLIAIVRDGTFRKQLKGEWIEQLAAAREQVRRGSELTTLKADFTAMIAHELGTSHALIGAQVDLLDRSVISDADRARCHASIRAETHVLRRLASDIHMTSTFERDDFGICLRTTKVAALLADVEMVARVYLADYTYTVDVDPSVGVLADQDRVGQVMRNLIGNAAKHTPPGTLVEVRVTHLDQHVWFEVADQGPGIPPHELSRIWSKFGRGCDARGAHVPGAGLGLYLSRRIIMAHGTEINVVSERGKGTSFRFALPVVL